MARAPPWGAWVVGATVPGSPAATPGLGSATPVASGTRPAECQTPPLATVAGKKGSGLFSLARAPPWGAWVVGATVPGSPAATPGLGSATPVASGTRPAEYPNIAARNRRAGSCDARGVGNTAGRMPKHRRSQPSGWELRRPWRRGNARLSRARVLPMASEDAAAVATCHIHRSLGRSAAPPLDHGCREHPHAAGVLYLRRTFTQAVADEVWSGRHLQATA